MRYYICFRNLSFSQDTGVEQFLLTHLVFNLLFCWGCLCDLQKSFESKIIPSSSFLFSDMMVWSSILTLTLSFPWLFLLFIFMYFQSNHLKRTLEKSALFLLLLNHLFCKHYEVWYHQRHWLLRRLRGNRISHTKRYWK